MWCHQVRGEQRHGWREGLHLQSIQCLYTHKVDTEQNRKPACLCPSRVTSQSDEGVNSRKSAKRRLYTLHTLKTKAKQNRKRGYVVPGSPV